MQSEEKFRSDLERWERSLGQGTDPSHKALDDLRHLFFKSAGAFPDEMLSDFFTTFLEKLRDGNRAAALGWLAAVESLLAGEYDGTKLPLEDWVSIRETVSPSAGDIDVDRLTEIMALVMDHGALY